MRDTEAQTVTILTKKLCRIELACVFASQSFYIPLKLKYETAS